MRPNANGVMEHGGINRKVGRYRVVKPRFSQGGCPHWAGMRTSVNPSTRSNDFKATEELVTPKASPTPSANTIFTEDAAAKAREILRRKLANLPRRRRV